MSVTCGCYPPKFQKKKKGKELTYLDPFFLLPLAEFEKIGIFSFKKCVQASYDVNISLKYM
jgi:hypothetical protein